jgi:arylsulfatase A-like enzyme
MPRPNIVLLTIECWRGDYFGSLTPCLSCLGEVSCVFSDAQSPGGWTRISMTAIMSSAYASMYGGSRIALATPERRVLAECLLDSGYWTAGFTANWVCGSAGGFHRGFGKFHELSCTPVTLPAGAPNPKEWERMVEMGIPPRDLDTFADAANVTNLGQGWIESRKPDEPWFLWLHYLDPHWPCLTRERPSTSEEIHRDWYDRELFRNQVQPARGRFDPGPETTARWIRRYRDALRSTDREVGRLIEFLRSRPDWDNTIVAITGDHGEELFERGTWHHEWNQLHREGINVPLIVRVPAGAPRKVSEPVGLLDLAPTLLDYAGISQPPAMMGASLRPLLAGEASAARPVFTEMLGTRNSANYLLAIRDREWKYIYELENPHHSKLFHVSDDPEELRDLRGRFPEVLRRFDRMRFEHSTLGLTRLLTQKTLSDSQTAAPGVSLNNVAGSSENFDPLLREHLVALGYL